MWVPENHEPVGYDTTYSIIKQAATLTLCEMTHKSCFVGPENTKGQKGIPALWRITLTDDLQYVQKITMSRQAKVNCLQSHIEASCKCIILNIGLLI